MTIDGTANAILHEAKAITKHFPVEEQDACVKGELALGICDEAVKRGFVVEVNGEPCWRDGLAEILSSQPE